MYSVFFRLLILLSMFFSGTILACSGNETCIKKSTWHLGIALGLGVKTNPLVDGDDIPLVILPDVAWYAEKAYFDNGELGYQWINQSKYAFETFIQLDRESAFFSFLHPANILTSSQSVSPSTPEIPLSPDSSDSSQGPEQNPDIDISGPSESTGDDKYIEYNLSIDHIASRKWAINGGIRGHYYLSSGEWQLTFQQDISNVHQGQQVGLEYAHRWQWQDFRLGLRIGSDWKSARLIDYYYGVSQRDTKLTDFYFNGKSGWQTYMSIDAQKPINENWSWLANIGYRKLPDTLTRSPLMEQNSISKIFLGVAYRF